VIVHKHTHTHTHRHRQTDRQTDTFITILFSPVGGGVKIKTSDAHDAMNLGALKAAIRHEVQKTRKVITTTFNETLLRNVSVGSSPDYARERVHGKSQNRTVLMRNSSKRGNH